MKTYDSDEVFAVLSPLKAKFDTCANGESDACMKLDEQLECYAQICCQVSHQLTMWAVAVFSGEVVFDPEAEEVFRSEARQIYSKASRLWVAGRKAEVPCFELPGQTKLQAALFELRWLLDGWVSPKLSVSPAARVRFHPSEADRATIQRQLGSLPPYEPRAKTKRK